MAATGNEPPADRAPPGGAAPPRGHRLSQAALAIPIRTAAGFGGGAPVARDGPLPQPLTGERYDLPTGFGRLACYAAGPDREGAGRPPLLLVHSINAAGSAFEIAPIFDRERQHRRVVAFDLPGYGLSDRPRQLYTPRTMTDAILDVVDDLQARYGPTPIDALALSLSSEFLARAAAERPAAFRSVALVSPTGLDSRGPRLGPPGTTRGMPRLYKVLTVDLWRQGLFALLTSGVSIRYFLEKTWGSKQIDEGLFDYDLRTTRQPGAEHAPYSFIGGFLFSDDITRIYESLRLPVLMVHGVRGDFVDYAGKHRVEGRPNWDIAVMQTGALPQFEQPDAFVALFDAFLDRLSSSQREPGRAVDGSP